MLSYLKQLEYESIYVIREALSQFKRPVILFSGGKDSITMTHLIKKSVWPEKVSIPLLHIDTEHNFPETIEFRDQFAQANKFELLVRSVQKTIEEGKASEMKGQIASRNKIQSITLLDAIRELEIDCCFGGGRRDEEKARAKERFFSHRDDFGQWNPKKQRPELWNLYNGSCKEGEHFRVFPLSNWTEEDIWQYLSQEKIGLPSLYFSHQREVFQRNGVLYAKSEFVTPKQSDQLSTKQVRFRTIGDITSTGAIESTASNFEEIIEEMKSLKVTERGNRADDKSSLTAMEDRKQEGYF